MAGIMVLGFVLNVRERDEWEKEERERDGKARQLFGEART